MAFCVSVVLCFGAVGWWLVNSVGKVAVPTRVKFCSTLHCLLGIQMFTLPGGSVAFSLGYLLLTKDIAPFLDLISLIWTV